MNARGWAERARNELRASGETSRPRVAAAFEQLSPQEMQIVQLAAAGFTNREIGQQLYVSPRTVSSHLYHAFPKLGVTSRANSRRPSRARVWSQSLPEKATNRHVTDAYERPMSHAFRSQVLPSGRDTIPGSTPMTDNAVPNR